MTRIITVGDIHISDRPPSSCTDTYLDDIFEMLRYVALLEKDLNADAVVWAGDIFHHKQPSRTSHKTMLRTIDVVREYQNLWIVVGNHDILNDRVESIDETQPLGVLLEAGAHKLEGWHPTLPLYGVPWQQRWTEEDAAFAPFELWRSAGGHSDGHVDIDTSKALAVTHAPIYPPGLELEFEFVPTGGDHGISKAMGNQGFIYYGHIHEPHGIFEADGVTYANHGAISRGSLHEYNLKREIAVTLWTPEDGFTKIDIPHKPAEEVFRLQEAAIREDKAMDLDAFLSSVGDTKLEITSVEAVTQHIATLSIEPRVAKIAIELLQEQS